ncbi:MAG TPA: hypothetical protein VFB21_14565, partial [Chthonomonadaceae bacterium]|nr:hypothetical protein [Chthonomonadaceae bacterium]
IKHTTLVLYPVSPFLVSAPGFDATQVGTLIAADYGWVKDRHNSFVVGGWAWLRDGSDILELHGKYYFAPHWGVQAGLLGSTYGGGNPWDLFLTHHFTLGNPNARHAIQMLAGAGIFYDPAGNVGTTGFSGFLQAETPLSGNWTLNFSYWYLQDKGLDGHRFGLGVGVRF